MLIASFFYFFFNFRFNVSKITAIEPSPETLQAVPNPSCATCNAIISDNIELSKPKIDCKIPDAANIAPQGTPGAATIIIPKIIINGIIADNSIGFPLTSITATEHAVIDITLPDKCIVEHNGNTKSAISDSTPFFFEHRIVIGITATDDCVAIADKYAGITFFMSFIGFFFETKPAIIYCTNNVKKCSKIIVTKTFEKTASILNT